MGSIQRGAIISKNSSGTLERVDGSSTYIGSATLESGEVVTKKFRSHSRDDNEVTERWLRWQGKNVEKDEEEEIIMDKTNKAIQTCTCPFSGRECGALCPIYSTVHGECSFKIAGVSLLNMCTNMMRLDMTEPLELMAMAIAESKPTAAPKVTPVECGKTATEGVKSYLADKRFLDFVNLHSKAAYTPYKKFCTENDYPFVKESEFSKRVKENFPELKSEPSHGGVVFVA